MAVGPDGTESLTHVPFETCSYIRNALEYRKVLPEAPLERIEGTARVAFPHPGGSVRKPHSPAPDSWMTCLMIPTTSSTSKVER